MQKQIEKKLKNNIFNHKANTIISLYNNLINNPISKRRLEHLFQLNHWWFICSIVRFPKKKKQKINNLIKSFHSKNLTNTSKILLDYLLLNKKLTLLSYYEQFTVEINKENKSFQNKIKEEKGQPKYILKKIKKYIEIEEDINITINNIIFNYIQINNHNLNSSLNEILIDLKKKEIDIVTQNIFKSLYREKKKPTFTVLNITIKLNNIFASVTNNKGKISKFVIPLRSTNQFGFKVSKVTTRFYLEEFLEKYFRFISLIYEQNIKTKINTKKTLKKKSKIKSMTFKKNLALNLVCPPKYKNKIIRMFFNYVSLTLTHKRNIILDIRASKIFNGCRGKKLLRKKRLKLKYLNKHFL